MNTIIIHGLWFVFGAACMFVLIVAIAPGILSSRISQAQEAYILTPDEYEPITPPAENPELTEAKATARFYQDLYMSIVEDMRRS